MSQAKELPTETHEAAILRMLQEMKYVLAHGHRYVIVGQTQELAQLPAAFGGDDLFVKSALDIIRFHEASLGNPTPINAEVLDAMLKKLGLLDV